LSYALIVYGYINNISKSNNKNNNPKMKNEIENWVLFCPKKEWNPHSKAVFFSKYGLWYEKIKFINNNTIDIIVIINIYIVKLCILFFTVYSQYFMNLYLFLG